MVEPDKNAPASETPSTAEVTSASKTQPDTTANQAAARTPKIPHEKFSATPVRDYWPHFRSRAFLATFCMQIAITLAILVALKAGGLHLSGVTMIVVGLAIFVATTASNFLLLQIVLAPFKDLLSALVNVAGEPTTTTPPNPNSPRYARDGFKYPLQTIYELASARPFDSAEKQAATSSELSLLQKGLNETTTGIVMLDKNHQVIYANRAAPTRINANGATELTLLFDDPKNTLTTWLAECEASAVHATKTWRRVPDKLVGEEDRRIFDVAASYEKGSDAEVVLVFYDLSNIYQPEDDDLDFIAFAAHELRGPITVIRGYLDVFGDEMGAQMTPEQKELLQRLVVSANRLSTYVNNILNASRYDRRHLQVRLIEDSLPAIYATIADDMQQRAHAQNRLLAVNFPADLPTIAADRASLSEVLGNLIDNAIKYSNEGGSVNVTARLENNFVIVSVEDHGIGMPGSVISNLFHKFYRSHRSRETVAGTGIGLYISKAIVESHGGQIGVRSVEGMGSVFEFSVPTYASVAEKLASTGGDNQTMISSGGGWINNHSMYRG